MQLLPVVQLLSVPPGCSWSLPALHHRLQGTVSHQQHCDRASWWAPVQAGQCAPWIGWDGTEDPHKGRGEGGQEKGMCAHSHEGYCQAHGHSDRTDGVRGILPQIFRYKQCLYHWWFCFFFPLLAHI